MCSGSSYSPRGAYAHLLPPSEPCFIYTLLPIEHEMPDVTGEEELFNPEMIAKAFPDEFEYQTVLFLSAACFYDETMKLTSFLEWQGANWGFIDRLLGRWWMRRSLRGKWVAIKRLVGRGHAGLDETMMRRHLWFFSRDKAFRLIRGALTRLADRGIVTKTVEEIPQFGAMVFYALTPQFVYRLRHAHASS